MSSNQTFCNLMEQAQRMDDVILASFVKLALGERAFSLQPAEALKLMFQLDSTHFTEYTHAEFATEIESGRIEFSHYESRWGGKTGGVGATLK